MLDAAYAYLAEKAVLRDAIQSPVYLTRGLKASDVEAASHRAALDAWLDGPSAQERAYEDAVNRELRGG